MEGQPQIPVDIIHQRKIEKRLKTKIFPISDRHFKIGPCIGIGTYCKVYTLIDLDNPVPITLLNKWAVKVEDKGTTTPQLHFESGIYDDLKGEDGIPTKIFYTSDGLCRYLIIKQLGPSLQEYLKLCGKFTLKTVILLAIQLLTRLQSLHSKNYICRDVKPADFLTIYDETGSKIIMIDFGLAKSFVDEDGNHIPFRAGKKRIGTQPDFLYDSVNNHKGFELSRRDDLESLGYMLIHFRKGSLPWSNGLGVTASQNNDRIWKCKMQIELLCEGLPLEFEEYMKYCKSLKFDESPNYDYLKQMFLILLRMEGYKNDGEYDWIEIAKSKSKLRILNCVPWRELWWYTHKSLQLFKIKM